MFLKSSGNEMRHLFPWNRHGLIVIEMGIEMHTIYRVLVLARVVEVVDVHNNVVDIKIDLLRCTLAVHNISLSNRHVLGILLGG